MVYAAPVLVFRANGCNSSTCPIRCDPGSKQQLLDRLCEADKPVPTNPPRPVLLLEHCTGLATMMHTYRLAAAHVLEQRHFITHRGARLSMYTCVICRGSKTGRPDKPHKHISLQPWKCTGSGNNARRKQFSASRNKYSWGRRRLHIITPHMRYIQPTTHGCCPPTDMHV